MSNIVKYKNEMNTVPFRSFNSVEMDLFFSICSKMKDRGGRKIKFTFKELTDLSDYKRRAISRFIADIESTFEKLQELNFRIETEKKIIKFTLFPEVEIDKDEHTVEIKVSERFEYILNNLLNNFTKFELEEFTELQSSYSKTAYRLLKQFRRTGYFIIQIDEFRRLFDVPESYKMGNIDQRILTRIEEELPKYFKNLKINKLKGKGKRKRYIENIEFKFEPETDIKNHSKKFRDSDGNYYERRLEDFTNEEVKKTFPETRPLSEQK